MADTDRRRSVPSELGVAALVVAASLPLSRLFRTGGIGSASFAATIASLTVAWAMRRFRAPTLAAAAVSMLAFVWFASVAFFRDSMLGPLPTPHSASLIWHAAVDAIHHSQTDVAPVAASPAFLCLASFGVWATAWLADDAAIKLRHPMLAIGVTVPLYVLPGTILVGSHRWIDAGAYLAAALWVLFQDERYRLSRWGRVVGTGVPGWRPGLAARMGVVAIGLALVATPILPGFGAPPGLRGATGAGTRSTLRPLVQIKAELGSHVPIEEFTVRTRVPTYWRITALDRFDGSTWTSGTQRPLLPLSGRSIQPQNPASTFPVREEITIRQLGGPWLPAGYEPIRIDGIGGAAADPESRSVISPRDLTRGLKYQVLSMIPQLTYEELSAAPFTKDALLAPYLALPARPETQRITELTHGVVVAAHADKAGPFVQAVALQNYLRTFTYDENVKLRHNIIDIEDFLVNAKRGYCEQFAASMAMMARTLGLPSRVAIGFAGGGPGRTVDETLVTSRNAHAWVEIWFAGYGWVQFEPTPRSDSVVVPAYTSPSIGPAPTPSAVPTDTAAPSPSPTSSPRGGTELETRTKAGTSVIGRLVPVGIVVAGCLMLLALAFPIASALRRGLRRRRADSAQERIAVRYLDFLDWCAAAGCGRRTGETPHEHARRLAEVSSDARASAETLASMAVDAVYARPNGIDTRDVALLERAARADIAATLPRRTRILSKLGWGWWRADPASRRPRRERERTLARLPR